MKWVTVVAMLLIAGAAVLVVLSQGTGCSSAAPLEGLHLEAIRLPPGFAITVFAGGVPGARSLALGARGTVFVGTRDQGKVYALTDEDGDGRAERVRVLLEGLDTPNGVAFRDGDLLVAEISRILRYADIEERLDAPPAPEVVFDELPAERAHGWKFIAFAPDGALFVPVGAPGNNVLREDDPRFASILRIDLTTRTSEVHAHGVRNTVGFDWQPGTGELWFTDNGRDWLGDDRPPDELNRAPRSGLHFGFPFWHGRDIPDPDYGSRMAADAFVKPEMLLGAHVAALGMRFYDGTAFPEEYRGDVFIAEHGSWNRSKPVGYRVMRVRIDGAKALTYEVFAEGWLLGDRAWGRPVDVLVMPDGALLVSDDRAGVVYRIAWAGR